MPIFYSNEGNQTKWLDAYTDIEANLCTLSQCMTFVGSDSGYRLTIADLRTTKPKLRVFSGTSFVSEQNLPDVPAGVVSFYSDRTSPAVPGVAVACGADILMFRNNRPYFKFSCPLLPTVEQEQDAWRRLADAHPEDVPSIVDSLRSVPFDTLTPRSQSLLNLNPDLYVAFVAQHESAPLERKPIITCMTTLKRKEESQEAVSCIVVGTEAGDVMFIDTQAFSILHQARVCSTKVTPVEIKCVGQYDVEFRCIVACREGNVCVLRRGWLEGRTLCRISDGAILSFVIIPGELSVIVATNKKMLYCFSKKGKTLWTIQLPAHVTTMTTIPLQHLSRTLVAVALRGGTIRLYKGRQHIDSVAAPNTVDAIGFGPLGREDCVLVFVTVDGALTIKILKRTADFNVEVTGENDSSARQATPLQVPKKTKLFVEQTNRERQHATDMHQTFQQELCRLRLVAARAVVQSLENSENSTASLRLSARVLGLGPVFTLVISLENTNVEKPLLQAALVLHAPKTTYALEKPYIELPMIVPSVTYEFRSKITEQRSTKDQNVQETEDGTAVDVASIRGPPIKVFVVRAGRAKPLLAATIHMPSTDPTDFS